MVAQQYFDHVGKDGSDPVDRIRATGYIPSVGTWTVGENLAWGTGEEGSVREIFRAWMRSPGHRQNILGGYSQIGVGVEVGTLAGRAETYVWTQHFGSHCDAPPAQV